MVKYRKYSNNLYVGLIISQNEEGGSMSIEIKVCMGSACHIKGAPKIAQAFDEELRARGLDEHVKLMGSFCRKMCIDGVNVEVNNVLYSHVTVDDVKRLVDIAMGVEV